MKTVRLYGWLGERFGSEWTLDVTSPQEAMRAISCQTRGFSKAVLEHKPGFKVIVGKNPISTEEVAFPVSSREVIKVIPVTAGSKDDVSGFIFGAALIGLSFLLPVTPLFTLGTFAPSLSSIAFGFGVNMVIGGIAQALTSTPNTSSQPSPERPENRPSYVFNGAVNTTTQGNPVPVLYGVLEVGSQVISGGIYAEELIPVALTTTPEPVVTPPESNTTQQVYDYSGP